MPVVNEVLTDLPYYATAAGAAVGAVYDFASQHRIECNRQPLNEAWGEIAAQQSPSLRDRTKRLLATTAIFGALGSGIGLVWREEQPLTANKAKVEVVVDRSGATYGAPAEAITGTIEKIEGHDDIDAEAVVGQVGVNHPTSMQEAAKAEPFGDAHVDEAVNSVLDALKLQSENSSHTGKDAVVVLTDGHEFGNARGIVRQAKAPDVQAPVYVVNVDKNSNESTEATFNKIAHQTGGQYWHDPSQADIDKLINSLEPPKAEARNNTSLPLKIFVTALDVLAGLGYAKMRRHLPLTWGGLKKREEI